MPAENSPTLLTAKDLVVRFNDRTILDHAGYGSPVICTPDELFGLNEDEN